MTKEEQKIWFDAVLYPHRSLGPKGFIILMALIAGINFAVGLMFFLKGAWPVLGFLGLDVLLIYVAFKLNYRSGKYQEVIRLQDDDLLIQRIDRQGIATEWHFNPYWVDVRLDYRPQDHSSYREKYVLVSSHGQGLFVGLFLSPDERQEMLSALKDALMSYKTSTL